MKCIVQSLLDESGPELREELMKGEGLQLEDVEVCFCININNACAFSHLIS